MNHLICHLRRFTPVILVCLLCVLTSCSENTTDPKSAFTLTGKVVNPKNILIPDNARLSAIWKISAGSPDYGYYYGKGTINTSDNTFTLRFPEELPTDALNRNATGTGGLGVGVLLCYIHTSPIGRIPTNTDLFTDFYGMVENRGIIYIGGDPANVTFRSWAKNFKTGYNYASVVYSTSGFDYFVPSSSTTDVPTLRIDTLAASFQLLNWTIIKPDSPRQ